MQLISCGLNSIVTCYNFKISQSNIISTELQVKEQAHKALSVDDEDSVSAYYRIRQQLETLGRELRHFILKPTYLLPFLQPGRVVKVSFYFYGSFNPCCFRKMYLKHCLNCKHFSQNLGKE